MRKFEKPSAAWMRERVSVGGGEKEEEGSFSSAFWREEFALE